MLFIFLFLRCSQLFLHCVYPTHILTTVFQETKYIKFWNLCLVQFILSWCAIRSVRNCFETHDDLLLMKITHVFSMGIEGKWSPLKSCLTPGLSVVLFLALKVFCFKSVKKDLEVLPCRVTLIQGFLFCFFIFNYTGPNSSESFLTSLPCNILALLVFIILIVHWMCQDLLCCDDNHYCLALIDCWCWEGSQSFFAKSMSECAN